MVESREVAVSSVLARLMKRTWMYTNNDRGGVEGDGIILVIDVNRDIGLVHHPRENEPKNAGLLA